MNISPAIATGVKLFVQQTVLRQLPNEEKWVKDEEDLRIELSRVADLVEDTKDMLGRQMYRNQKYNFAEDAKKTLEYCLMVDEDETATALRRKHYMPLFHTVLEPVLDALGELPHEEALKVARQFTDEVYQLACTMDVNLHLDDGIVAKSIIRASYKQREADRKAAIAALAKEKRRKKKQEIEELIAEEPAEDDEE